MSLFVTGDRVNSNWNVVSKTSDFFYLKGMLTTLLERLGIQKYKVTPADSSMFSEGIALSLGKKNLVTLGVVKRNLLKEFGIKQEVLYADFNWDTVLTVTGKKQQKVSALAKVPCSKKRFGLVTRQHGYL